MRKRLTRVALAALAIVLLGAGAAQALRLNIGNSAISVTANFLPRELPEHVNAPVSVTSITRIKTSDGSQPSALKQIVFQFDKHGALDTKGLPTCTMAKLAETTPQEARKRCAGALVGTGTGRAEVTLPGAPPVQISSPLSFFNAPPIGGKPILIAHAYETIPTPQAVLVPMVIEKIKHGRYGYQVKIAVPPIADGYGSPTLAEATIGATRVRGGKTVGYTNARCEGGRLQVHGTLSFENGDTVPGTLSSPCHPPR